jgi:hypothetical protein
MRGQLTPCAAAINGAIVVGSCCRNAEHETAELQTATHGTCSGAYVKWASLCGGAVAVGGGMCSPAAAEAVGCA